MNSKDLIALLAYAAFLFAMYELYRAYLKAMTPEPTVVYVATAAEPEKGKDAE